VTSTAPIGGSAGASATPDSHGESPNCSATEEWPSPWKTAEDDLLYYFNVFREAGYSCGLATSAGSPALTVTETLLCAARLHSSSGFTAGGVAQLNEQAGASVNRTVEVVLTTDGTEPDPAEALAMLLGLSDNQLACTELMDPSFTAVGIGFAADKDVGFWTVDLATD
jgi:hypothetical protein